MFEILMPMIFALAQAPADPQIQITPQIQTQITPQIQAQITPQIQAQIQAQPKIEPLSPDKIETIKMACGLTDRAKFIDARAMASADELATYLEAFDHPIAAIYGANFPGEDVTVILEKLQGGCLYEADLSGSKAPGGEFANSSLILSSIEGADWSGIVADKTRFIGVNAKTANLAGAVLRGGLWKGAYWKSNLEKADFSGALMIGFRFECGITLDESCGGSSGANFSRADLSAADLAEFPSWGYDNFDKAFVEGARIHPRGLTGLKGIALGETIVLASHANSDQGVRISTAQALALRDESNFVRADKPSFDCRHARQRAEKIICGKYSRHLRKLDRDLARAYAQSRAGKSTSSRAQYDWLRKRNACDDAECVEAAYEERISALLAAIGTEIVLAPDASIQFHQDVLPLRAPMRETDLYRRILPVLKSASMQEVTLTGLEDGGIRIEGDAVGANAHLCGWRADTYYDEASGWYAAQVEKEDGDGFAAVEMFRIWDGRLTPRFSGNMGDTPPWASDFISCGARAGFGEMQALEGGK